MARDSWFSLTIYRSSTSLPPSSHPSREVNITSAQTWPGSMANKSRSDIIKANFIGNRLDAFRDSFTSICETLSIESSPHALDQVDEDLPALVFDLLLALQTCPAARLLRSNSSDKILLTDLSRLSSAILSDDFDFDRVKPLLSAVLNNESDERIWDKVYSAVTESTPPPRPLSSFSQTPWLRNTSSFANSFEHRKYVDDVLKEELGTMYIDTPGFYAAFFGGVADLETASKAVFRKCREGSNPLYREEGGWDGWPKDAKEEDVLSWIAQMSKQFTKFAEDHKSSQTDRRRPLAQPNKPLQGSTAERKLDIGFVSDSNAQKDSKCHWSQILVPGELKSNPSADTASKAWLDLGRYAREVLATQDTRRFVLGFTLCGSLMRIWEFDRLGGIASERFDINKDGLRFVSTVLGFLWMNQEELGFDPTIITADGRRYIEIERNGQRERLIIDEVMKRAPCIAGRATTCWKAHREGDYPRTPLVIKDSWQYPERGEEGELLREATNKGVVNVARYYHHETVRVGGKDDDIRSNIREGLDITKAGNYRRESLMLPPSTSGVGIPRKSHSSSSTGRKRSSSGTDALLPPGKRSCSSSSTKAGSYAVPNRVHRRVIVHDYGKAIYKASSRVALLETVDGCIEGHASLYTKAGILQRDISVNNLVMNEDDDNPSWRSFLIDLDLAIKEQREGTTGARSKTGTRAFMAIGVLYDDEKHSFMHDLESFFWVLFWICIHYNGPNEGRVVPLFDKWNYADTEELAKLKLGTVCDEDIFRKTITEHFTEYYKPLLPWLNRLRRVVFPNGGRWKSEDRGLYSRMKEIIREAQKDPQVLADR